MYKTIVGKSRGKSFMNLIFQFGSPLPSQPSPTTDACTTSKQDAMRAAFLTRPRLDRHCAAVCLLLHESKYGGVEFSISQSKISQMHNSASWHFNINLLAVLPLLLRPEGRCGDRKRESLSVICDSPSANVSPKLSTAAEILR